MLAPVTRVLFCLALCMVLLSSWGCQKCIEYQDIASVIVDKNRVDEERNIDSVAIIANDSIIGCREYWYGFNVIGSKTHHVKFPINVRLQLFSQGDLQKELFFKVDKKTVSKVSYGVSCSASSKNPPTFLTDDYCLYTEKISDDSYDYMSCTELSVDGKREICGEL